MAPLINRLEHIVRHRFQHRPPVPPRDESSFLAFVDKQCHEFKLVATEVRDALRYLEGMPIVAQGKRIENIYILHSVWFEELFMPSVREDVKKNAFRYIIDGGSLTSLRGTIIADLMLLNCSIHKDPNTTTSSPREKRRVYCVATQIGQSAATTNTASMLFASSISPPQSAPGLARRFLDFVPTIVILQHWVLAVEEEPPQETNSRDPQENVFVSDLNVEENACRARTEPKARMPNGVKRFVGFTRCPNNEIEELGKHFSA